LSLFQKEKKIKKFIEKIFSATLITPHYIAFNENEEIENSLKELEDISSFQAFIVVGTNELFQQVYDIAKELEIGSDKYLDLVPISNKVDTSSQSIKSTDAVFVLSNFVKGQIRRIKDIKINGGNLV